MTKYLALTIGPIYETFAQVKKTRAVWAASYFFSWFMKELTIQTNKDGFKILMPALNGDQVTFDSQYGSGLYADRIYFEPSGKTKADLENIVKNIIAGIAKEIDPTRKELVENYLKQYLNIHIMEVDISEKGKVLKTMNDLLDQKELMQNYVFEISENHLINYLEEKAKDGFLALAAFGENYKERNFRSVSEIATSTLYRSGEKTKYIKALRDDFKSEDTDLIKELEEQKFDIFPYHKYYAVMYADGDNIGALLKAVSDDFDKLKGFSKQLFEFGQYAEKIIADYGGNGIYLGGEDILAFLPVACINQGKTETNTIFQLIHDLDVCFGNTIGAYAKENKVEPPTLSYGIMISYIKHPLKEAMLIAHELMENVAKKTPYKNSVALRLQKHSGQHMDCCIEKAKTCSWSYIKELVKAYSININDEKKTERKANADLLSGLIHRFKDDMYFEVFSIAARGNRLEPFFENFFDEKIHRGDDNPKNIFLKKVRELSKKVFNDYPDNQKCRDIIFTVLRYIHFINAEKE
ncbi:MAG: hypothetical protein M0R21_13005 [Lentimicrobiaceae bacterium]|nr:hypothetical protein [Lentimicrobiaceae bacterium]